VRFGNGCGDTLPPGKKRGRRKIYIYIGFSDTQNLSETQGAKNRGMGLSKTVWKNNKCQPKHLLIG
jgi:hypothetical protein